MMKITYCIVTVNEIDNKIEDSLHRATIEDRLSVILYLKQIQLHWIIRANGFSWTLFVSFAAASHSSQKHHQTHQTHVETKLIRLPDKVVTTSHWVTVEKKKKK